MYSQSEILEAIVQCLPYPNHISDIDIITEKDALRVNWRHDRFRISLSSAMVEQCENSCLAGSNLAILFEHLLKMALQKIYDRRSTDVQQPLYASRKTTASA